MAFNSLVPVGTKIINVIGLKEESDEVVFITTAGVFKMYHRQDCCEYVRIEDICGDVTDLIDATIAHFEERIEEGNSEYDSSTITFYDIQTDKGCINIRWLGESNGYYSESVNFEVVPGSTAVIKVVNTPNPLNLFNDVEDSKPSDIIQVLLPTPECEWETVYFYVIKSDHPKYKKGCKYTFNEHQHINLTGA